MCREHFCHAAMLALALVVVVVVNAEPLTTSQIHIRFTGENCPDISAVFVVSHDDDGGLYRKPAERVADCHWRFDVDKISTGFKPHYSLRIVLKSGEKTRSECREVAKDRNEAVLKFPCCNSEPVRTVTLRATPKNVPGKPAEPIPVGYVREVRERFDGMRREDRGIPCRESSSFAKGAGTITYLQFGLERLYLQIGFEDPKLGLLVNNLPDLSKSAVVPLTPDDVLYRLLNQGVKGQNKSAPRLSPPEIDVNAFRLEKVNLEHLLVTVD